MPKWLRRRPRRLTESVVANDQAAGRDVVKSQPGVVRLPRWRLWRLRMLKMLRRRPRRLTESVVADDQATGRDVVKALKAGEPEPMPVRGRPCFFCLEPFETGKPG